MIRTLTLNINGAARTVTAEERTPLLYVLRNDVGLNGPKFGCGLGQCGACAVLADGREIRSCVTPIAQAQGLEITTSEGLGTPAKPHPLQAAFIRNQAAQCGYCIPGMVVAAAALLQSTPSPSRTQIRAGMDGHLCRCGTHLRIVRAIEEAARAGVRT